MRPISCLDELVEVEDSTLFTMISTTWFKLYALFAEETPLWLKPKYYDATFLSAAARTAAGALTVLVPESADAAPSRGIRHLRTIHRLYCLRQPAVSRMPELHVCLFDDA